MGEPRGQGQTVHRRNRPGQAVHRRKPAAGTLRTSLAPRESLRAWAPLSDPNSPRHGPARGVSCGGLFSRRVRQRFPAHTHTQPVAGCHFSFLSRLQARVLCSLFAALSPIGMHSVGRNTRHYVENGWTFVYSQPHDELWFLVEPRSQRSGRYHKWVCIKSGWEVWWYGVYEDWGPRRPRRNRRNR